ncbi:TRAP transporter large permease [Enterocloster hominis (ex Liu et al. 2021)]|jgi:C4-dicarboxylate transporter DctM subunit|uniref:TRAP transporter large permease n=1 Tax=Enterocloster hominis (ex Liu et al. 2021) TaxID=2763663 RepID=UPI00292FA26E|nr:TRAP transporter large permease [Enterocloster hominis]
MVIKILVLFGTMFLLMMIGSPIAVALGVATMVTMTATTNISLTTMSTACLSGLDSFPLMAIPFFMLAGNLMKSGGISRRILDFADAVVGWVTGSVGMVTVVASMFFAALSGSSPATVTAIGGITIPEMKEEGYDPAYATAITAAAGTIGVIIPPSIPFVIYGVAAQCSISDLFLAGIIPGILIGVVLMIVNYVTAKKCGFGHTKKFHAGHLLRTLGDSIWALLVPVIILGGIYGGIFTPTESAVAAIIYSIFVGVFIYHELDLKSILEAFKETALINGQTTFLVGISMAFARFLTMSQVPGTLAKGILGISNPIAILLVINLFLLVVGCFIDNISSTVILTPILLPIVAGIGMSPIQFGIVMTVNLAIGFITPPYGCNLFFASAISNVSVVDIAKKILPMIGVMLIVLMALTFIPALSIGILDFL